MTTIPFTFDVKDDPWELPYRGSVGMWCLIAAESAMFLIFVVAYIYYMGKSLSGPTPKEILKIPIFGTICLLSSSITIHLSVDGLKKKSQLSFIGWLAGTILLGMIFLLGTAKEWLDLIYKHHFTIHTSLFGTTFYSLVGLHATHVLIGLLMLSIVLVLGLFGLVGEDQFKHFHSLSMYWHFVDAVWVVVLTVVYIVGR
ncbi:MAG TPA: heme-copper oxidase subunit III [Acidobacteriaceae bacterium]|jgi:cytochrome c oxidase subunit 3/cytochrome o ubiquinol oxidase subunit 3